MDKEESDLPCGQIGGRRGTGHTARAELLVMRADEMARARAQDEQMCGGDGWRVDEGKGTETGGKG